MNSPTFNIDPTPRRADGEYMAHARIIYQSGDQIEPQVLMSGDLAAFDLREDAINFARQWAAAWLSDREEKARARAAEFPPA
ncbi:hypothetical protein AWB76_05158 [Caballeronia temeraria]|uniref:Uncharacterized protein n=1 Tax=Caballeronia temeraria TaxID=1777137 RepID=A0A158C616_9BURK|nr:hypothetical protein [Caballeronia temeraria]SAK77763.1 hypothetical protein AWB76_05158 [Caballeronia temeraria]